MSRQLKQKETSRHTHTCTYISYSNVCNCSAVFFLILISSSQLPWIHKWVHICELVCQLFDWHVQLAQPLSPLAKSSPLPLLHHQTPDLLPTPSLFALLKSNQAQLCSSGAHRLPRDTEASSAALERESESVCGSPVAREESFCSNLVENVSTRWGPLYSS